METRISLRVKKQMNGGRIVIENALGLVNGDGSFSNQLDVQWQNFLKLCMCVVFCKIYANLWVKRL